MRYIVLVLFSCCVIACSTTYPLGVSPQEVQTKSNSNELDLINKNIILTLKDGTRHGFKIKNVTQDSIFSHDAEFKFSEIAAIESKEIDLLKTDT